jgi:hypothetical protein
MEEGGRRVDAHPAGFADSGLDHAALRAITGRLAATDD